MHLLPKTRTPNYRYSRWTAKTQVAGTCLQRAKVRVGSIVVPDKRGLLLFHEGPIGGLGVLLQYGLHDGLPAHLLRAAARVPLRTRARRPEEEPVLRRNAQTLLRSQ